MIRVAVLLAGCVLLTGCTSSGVLVSRGTPSIVDEQGTRWCKDLSTGMYSYVCHYPKE